MIIGIDPGNHGAFAFVGDNGALCYVEDMPLTNGMIAAAGVENLLNRVYRYGPTVILEHVTGAPNNGGSRAFTFGRGVGLIEMACCVFHLPVRRVTPQVWKRAMRVTKDKETSLARARELFPHSAGYFARKKDDGRAEAALIARWGWEQLHAEPRA